MDRYDVGEFVGLAGMVAFAAWMWLPAALLVASLSLLVETNLRSRGSAPIRSTSRTPGRVRLAATAARKAWAAAPEDVAA